MRKKPTLCETAKQAVRELREKHKVEPDIEEILWLNELGCLLEGADNSQPYHCVGRPCKAGNIWLWAPTFGGDAWYYDKSPLFRDTDPLALMLLAYALAHGRQPEILLKLQDYREIKKALKAWRKTIGATEAELCFAIDRVTMNLTDDSRGISPGETEQQKKARGQKEQDGTAGMIAWLCKHFGCTPDFWGWDIDKSHAMNMLNALPGNYQAADEAPDPNDPIVIANWNVRVAIATIIKDHAKDS